MACELCEMVDSWQLGTRIQDNFYCDLALKCVTGQHLPFLQCFFVNVFVFVFVIAVNAGLRVIIAGNGFCLG